MLMPGMHGVSPVQGVNPFPGFQPFRRKRVNPFGGAGARDSTGSLFILALAASLLWPGGWAALGQHHGSHPPLPGQLFYFGCQVEKDGAPVNVEVPLELESPSLPAELKQTVNLPEPYPPVRLVRYLPRAVRAQQIEPLPEKEGLPGVQLALRGPKQAYDLWLVAGDPRHNRLVSLIGTWRYMAVENAEQRGALWKQFKEEPTRPPKLLFRSPGEDRSHELAARPGAEAVYPEQGYSVKVLEFYPHFGYDRETGEPTNQSDRKLNPAALVEIRLGERREQRWVFARFPDFQANKKERLPIEASLDCPLDRKRPTPDFALVTVARSRHELWLRHRDKVQTRPLALDEEVQVPDSGYRFKLARFVPSGGLIETYQPGTQKGAVTALEVVTSTKDGRDTRIWLALGEERLLATPVGNLMIWFAAGPLAGPGNRHPVQP